MTKVYEGTAEQIVSELQKLPKAKKYHVEVTPEEPETGAMAPQMITYGMFSQLQVITEDDFRSAEFSDKDFTL